MLMPTLQREPPAYYAEYNPDAPAPAPVLGWYDTGFADYILPPPERLLRVGAGEWPGRFLTPFVADGALVAGPAPSRFVPGSVTNFQCRAVLLAHGLFDTVDGMVKAQGGVAFQAWEYANEVSRQGPLVLSVAGALGLTVEQIDDMFIEAWSVVA